MSAGSIRDLVDQNSSNLKLTLKVFKTLAHLVCEKKLSPEGGTKIAEATAEAIRKVAPDYDRLGKER